jgi:hypothetical protein
MLAIPVLATVSRSLPPIRPLPLRSIHTQRRTPCHCACEDDTDHEHEYHQQHLHIEDRPPEEDDDREAEMENNKDKNEEAVVLAIGGFWTWKPLILVMK